MKKKHEITAFRDETILLLNNRPLSVSTKDIATYLGVTTQWVNQFAKGGINNPGVNTVETLNRFLKDKIKEVSKNV